MIDPWKHWSDGEYVDGTNVLQEEQDYVYSQAYSMSEKYGEKATILRMTSLDASFLFMDNSIDFCYIDAQHDYFSAMEDMITWWKKVKPGGILAGHDYESKEEVKQLYVIQIAVNEFARKMGIHVFTTGESSVRSWYLFKN
jgi:predicted O-methyltransferase YrrM